MVSLMANMEPLVIYEQIGSFMKKLLKGVNNGGRLISERGRNVANK